MVVNVSALIKILGPELSNKKLPRLCIGLSSSFLNNIKEVRHGFRRLLCQVSQKTKDQKRHRRKNGQRQADGQGHLSGLRYKSESILIKQGCEIKTIKPAGCRRTGPPEADKFHTIPCLARDGF